MHWVRRYVLLSDVTVFDANVTRLQISSLETGSNRSGKPKQSTHLRSDTSFVQFDVSLLCTRQLGKSSRSRDACLMKYLIDHQKISGQGRQMSCRDRRNA